MVVGNGQCPLDDDTQVTRKVINRVTKAERDLSQWELEVLALVAQGRSNSEIAAALNLTEKTVGHCVSSIWSKLGASNRIEGATYAVEHNIRCAGNRKNDSSQNLLYGRVQQKSNARDTVPEYARPALTLWFTARSACRLRFWDGDADQNGRASPGL
ncbi:MAG: response regulator transcription factor [Chloroflexi bacterium]|nr:response regulator transcription factor [Chloroflexota bacterium]